MKRGFTVLAILSAAAFIMVAAGFIVPALTALYPVFSTTAGVSDGGYGTGIPFLRLARALAFTVFQAASSALLAIALGLPAAFLAARRSFPFRRALLALSGIPLCVPPAIIALAFVLFYGRNGYLNVFLMKLFSLSEPPVTFLYSTAGLVIAHGFYNFPVILRTVSRVWERLPENREEAAALLGASPARVFRTVILPQLAGSVLSGGLLVFLYCFFSFVIVLLFGGIGGTTLEVELYQTARALINFRYAGMIGLVETAAAALIVFAYAKLNGRLTREGRGHSITRSRKPLRGTTEIVFAVVYLFFIAVFFLGPLISIPIRSLAASASNPLTPAVRLSTAAWTSLFTRPSFLTALKNTLLVGTLTACTATLAALFFAFSPRNPERTSFSPIALAPLAVSSIMLGFGWTLLVLRGNMLVLVFAQSALAWPFAWTQIRAALDRIPQPVLDSARLLSKNPLDTVFRILLPLCGRGILSGAAFVFAISSGDAGLPLVLALPRFENLSLLLYRLAGSYRFAEACAVAVVLSVLTGFVFFLQDAEPGERI